MQKCWVSFLNPTYKCYDGPSVIEEVSANGSLIARYTQALGIDKPLVMLRGNTTSYYHADGHGSVTSLSDSRGNLVSSYRYDSFGNLTASTGSISNPFRYTGREFDAETGLYFYRARYYGLSIGRFISEDPIGFAGGTVNLYVHVGNYPVYWIDPLGLWSISFASYYGLGGGVSYDPNGSSPEWDPCKQYHGLNAGTGGYEGASVGLGPVYSGINGNAGANVAYESFNPYVGTGLEDGFDWGWSLSGGAATGIEITLY